MKVFTVSYEPSFRKPNGTFLIHLDVLKEKIPFEIRETSLISIPPTAFGGNHKHPRQEAFITFSTDLEFIWEDENNEIHREMMMKENELKLFIVEPFVPHVIVNRSTTNTSTLFEYAETIQKDVVPVDLLDK